MQSIYVCAYFGATKPGKKKKLRSMCVRACCKFSFFFFAGSSKSDSPDGPPLATWPPLVTRRPNTARARVSVGWNAKVSHSLDAHTSEMCTHVHTHTARQARTPQMSWLLLHVSQRGPGSLMAMAMAMARAWCEVRGGVRSETRGRCTVTLGFQEILMPRSAPDLPSNSRADMSRGWKVTQIRRRLGKKNPSKTRSQNSLSDKLLGSFLTRVVLKL